MSDTPCIIPPNPDVSGIGVRAAICAQNLACFLPVVIHLSDGKITKAKLKGIKDQSIGMLAIAFAILFTTIILAKGAGGNQTITSYHAAVVLDLSWMSNTSTWIWFILYVHYRSKRDNGRTEANWSTWRDILLEPLQDLMGWNGTDSYSTERNEGDCENVDIAQRIWTRTKYVVATVRHIIQRLCRLISAQPVLTLGSIHLSLMAGIGIWLWSAPARFGQPLSPNCDPILAVVGIPVRFSSTPLRILSLAIYFIVLIPGFNLVLPFLFFLALHISYNRVQSFRRYNDTRKSPAPYTAFLVVDLACLVAINILFIIDIELTLRRNKGDENGEENEWGFGQVLALLLLIIPLRDAWGALQEIREKLQGANVQLAKLIRRECQAEPLQAAEEIERLLEEEADPNFADNHFGSLLQMVAFHGRIDLLQILVKAAQSEVLNKVGGRYGTALCAACANGKHEIVEILLERGG
ncbi:Multiple ankyrin repeats single kh domain [Mycena venus]|uniref:Multiple ankyrin repeats single kh domain n=1 Tax=Mycena venus TaxID=2733690 RepID=A0A8H7CTY5_9AGAR|nr:Multiple ankyrin repeats single kh domain [Mycena venus]